MEREKWLKESEDKEDSSAKAKSDEDSQFFSMAQKAMKKLDSKSSGVAKPTKKPSSVVSPSKSRLFPLRPVVSTQNLVDKGCGV